MNFMFAKQYKSTEQKNEKSGWIRLWSRSSLKPMVTATFLATLLVSCRQSNAVDSSRSSAPSSVKTSLTLGVVTTPYNRAENYAALEKHLEEQLSANVGASVDITIDSIELKGENPLQQARNRLAEQKWDIAFTTSPILSVSAMNNDYEFVARMFPQSPKFESSLFVLKESQIQGINDLNPDKTIALGELSNPASFYIPVYDLYGKIIKVDRGNPDPQSIVDKVKSAQADVGAAPYQIVARDPQLRVIQRSRSIPLSGVYLSPRLPKSERDSLKTALLNASEEIQKKAQYGAGEEPDYQYLIGITNRVDTILSCVDLDRQPVQLYCSESNDFTRNTTNGDLDEIVAQGQVNGYQMNGENVTLTVNGENGQTYRIFVPRPLLDRIPNALPLAELQDKTIQIYRIEPTKNGATTDFNVDQPEQLTIIN
jgi:ABC-type phosphate/phosphonate transport system substrate-binding protein